MGAAFSTSNSVFIQLERTDYAPGDVVRAVVCANFVEAFECVSIEAELHGSEKTYWWEQVSRDGKSWQEHRGATWDFLTATVALPDTHRRFPAGQYQWPVVLALPTDAPDSAHVGSDRDGARITYKLRVTLKPAALLGRKMKVFQRFSVHGQPKTAPLLVEASGDHDAVTCCCFRQGQLAGRVTLDRDWWRPGEPPITASVEVDNRTKKPAQGVEVSLKQVSLASEAAEAKRGWLTDSKTFSYAVAETQLPGVPPHASLNSGQAQRVVLQPPSDLQPSVEHGGLLSVKYVVRLKVKMGFGTKDLKVKAPVRVYAAPPPGAALQQQQEEEDAAAVAAMLVGVDGTAAAEGEGEALPFLTQPPPFWAPTEVLSPVAIEVPSAPPLPADALHSGAPFWARAASNGGRDGPPAVLPGCEQQA